MPNQIAVSILTMYNIDETIFDKLVLPDYHFPRSIEYEDLFLIEGWSLDKQTLIDNILLECAELDTLYTNPEFLKFAIGAWCRKEFPVWRALYETLFYKYNPIWNKDGSIKDSATGYKKSISNGSKSDNGTSVNTNNTTENIEDEDNTERTGNDITINTSSKKSDNTANESGNKVNVDSGTNSKENTESGESVKSANNTNVENSSNLNINKVSAYDETDFSNKERTEISDNKTNVGTDNETNTTNNSNNGIEAVNKVGTETNSGTRFEETEESENDTNITNNSENNNRKYNRGREESNNSVNTSVNSYTDTTDTEDNETNNNERIEKGNIGIVTTQKMIAEERELVQFNIYDYIIDSFKARFCILVY